jgi:ABC-2 type transport system permease protein
MHRSILIIARSEFLRRVRGKGFLIGTLVAPIALVAFMGLIGGAAVLAMRGDTTRVAVVDSSGVLLPRLQAETNRTVRFVTAPPGAALRDSVQQGALDGLLLLPAGFPETGRARLIAGGDLGLTARETLEGALASAVRAERLARLGVSDSVRAIVEAGAPLDVSRLTEEGEKTDTIIGDYALGFAMGILIYMMTLLYGSFVMQGVIEEKQTRVAEVMVSAVKPFDLMMGKVLGMGAVSLVQIVLWIVISGIGMSLVGGGAAALFGGGAEMPMTPGDAPAPSIAELMPAVTPGVIIAFLLFFAGGYLLYASLFAAIGSAVEQPQEAQGLTLPVMLPIVGSFICLQFVLQNPTSPGATLLSLVPFFAPVLMPPRMALATIPWWEVALSFAMLVAGFVATIWVAARIYRVGLLSYGKRPSLRDLWRWLRYAG